MRAVVLGLGASGRAAIALLRRIGAREIVGVDRSAAVSPIDGARLELGPHRVETFTDADLVVVSPGVPPDLPELVAARAGGVEVLGELGLAERYALPDRPRIAITGTNGKSTTTHLAGQLLAAVGLHPFVGGNLGTPACAAGPDHGAYVIEVSSYQLELAGAFRAEVGLILNLTPDHLARHKTMEGYADAKCRLFAHARPDDLCVIPARDPLLTNGRAGVRGRRAWLGDLPGASRDGRAVTVELADRRARFDLTPFTVPGEHNLDNLAAALLACFAVHPDARALQDAIGGLTALAHRMEVAPTGDGRTWIDDSKATNVDSTRAALRGLSARTVLLLGGQAKGAGFAALAPLPDAVHTVICFGDSGPAIADELAGVGVQAVRVGSLAEAVEAARARAASGDQVLLSPGCASFDAFENFEHRGREFKRLAREN